MSTRKVIFEKKGKLIFQPLIFRGHVRFFRRLMILPQLLKDLFSLKALFFGVTLRSIGPRVSVGFRKSPKNHENHHCSTVNVDLGKHHGRAAPPNNMPAAKKKKTRPKAFPHNLSRVKFEIPSHLTQLISRHHNGWKDVPNHNGWVVFFPCSRDVLLGTC